MQWAEKYGEKKDVCNAIGAHHDEIEMDNLISPVFKYVMLYQVLDLELEDKLWRVIFKD